MEQKVIILTCKGNERAEKSYKDHSYDRVDNRLNAYFGDVMAKDSNIIGKIQWKSAGKR